MSKVISFSISDRYLDKIRSLYPDLTDNLAAKQALIDRLDASLSSSLDDSLDGILDDGIKTLIESWVDGLLDERLDDAVKKSVTSLSERMARLEERLDGSLDERLDDMELLLRMQREASIANPPIEGGNGDNPDLPPSPDAIEDSQKKILETVKGSESRGILSVSITDKTIDAGEDAIETDDREWLSLQQIAEKKIKGLPGTQQGLRRHAKNWESRKNPQKRGEQYKIPKEYLK